jgi:D-threonine aldolase
VEGFAAAVERLGVTPAALGARYVVFFVYTTLLGVLDRPRLRGLSAPGRRRGAVEGGLTAIVPRTVTEIPTPALVIDEAAMERNIARMAAYFAGRPCKLRPHFKAHKCSAIARRQLAAGSCTGLTCATVAEAEAASALCDDILIANEVVAADKCRRVAALAARAHVTIALDSVAGLERMAAVAQDSRVAIGVVIDVNVGQNRCGVAPGSDAVDLARRVLEVSSGVKTGAGGLFVRGLMGYEGHAVGIADRHAREAAVHQAMEGLAWTVRMFRDRGLPTDVVSAGGTGSYDISSQFPEVSEIQAGSYVLMDTDYASQLLPFEHALAVLGGVISRPTAERCVADCGHKACTKDHGHPTVKDPAGASVLALNDEHAIISLPPGCTLDVGGRIQLLPSHIDPTMNLHDVVYALDGDAVVGVWAIEARGYPEQRQLTDE